VCVCVCFVFCKGGDHKIEDEHFFFASVSSTLKYSNLSKKNDNLATNHNHFVWLKNII